MSKKLIEIWEGANGRIWTDIDCVGYAHDSEHEAYEFLRKWADQFKADVEKAISDFKDQDNAEVGGTDEGGSAQ